MSFTFTGLLSNSCNNMNMSDRWGASLLKSDDCFGIESPSSFKSLPPSSLPLSPSSIYHSYSDFPPGFSPTELLNAPLFLSSSNSFNWRNTSSEDQQSNKEDEKKNYSDPSFETQTEHVFLFESSSSMFQEDQLKEQDTLKFNEPSKQMNFSYEMTATEFKEPSTQNFFSDMALTKPEIQSNSALGSNYVSYTDSSKSSTEQKGSEDGYNWRKYGEKQMKGSENPRSYYKCTHPNCSMKKKVEKTLDGHITEIVYKGSHNHPKPESARMMSAQSLLQHSSSGTNSGNSDQSVGEEDFEQTSPRSYNGGDEDEYGQRAKRWKGENENNGIAYSTSGSITVKEPRVIVQTTSEIDILDDGYRWRKYGQKVVKGNPNPRSYYKCVTPGCSVRKHVERAAHDVKAVITTYEGKHNHEVPIGRGSSSYSMSRTSLDNYISNVTAPTPIRPSAVMNNFSSSPILTNLLHDTELPGPGIQEPFPLDKLLSPGGSFGYSASGRSIGSYANQGQHSGAAYSATDKEQNESFLKSFLSKNL